MKSLEPCMFRATRRAWLGDLALPYLFFCVVMMTIVVQLRLPVLLAGLGIGFLSVYAIRRYVLPMTRTWLLFERSLVEGSLNGKGFHMYYAEILAAWQIDRGGWRYLCLGTRRGTVVYPLHFLDGNSIWNEITLRAPADALAETAITRLPDYQDWVRERSHWINRKDAAHVAADHWALQVAGWGTLAFALMTIASSVQKNDLILVILMAALAGLAMVILAVWGVTEITPESVRRSTLVKNTRMAWADVQRIEVDPFGIAIVMVGQGCQLVVPGPAFWTSNTRKNMLEYLLDQARYKRVPVRRTLRALARVTYFSRARR